jgi:hypothetical protein
MTSLNPVRPFAPQMLFIFLAVSVALVYTTQSGDLVAALIDARFVRGIPYARSIFASLSDFTVMIALVSLAARRWPASIIALAGFNASPRRPLLWAAIWFLPALAICVIMAKLASDVSAGDVAWEAVGGPFSEEFVYRGLAVGVLVRLCGWSWLPACILPAIFFGAAHVWEGSDLETIAGVVAITTIGGILFGWLFVKWGFNLWPSILLHVALNGLWLVFNLGENAIGGWLGNGLRLAVIAIAVATTFWFASKQRMSGAN